MDFGWTLLHATDAECTAVGSVDQDFPAPASTPSRLGTANLLPTRSAAQTFLSGIPDNSNARSGRPERRVSDRTAKRSFCGFAHGRLPARISQEISVPRFS
jgi:hypothetical protein